MKTENKIIPISTARPGIQRVGFKGVTIHETANYRRSATADSHAVYMAGAGNNSQVSSHYYVDDEKAVLCVPENEVCWHASDGRTTPGGNMSTVAIEICCNWGYVPVELTGYQSLPTESQVDATTKSAAMARFTAAVDNAAYLAADILYRNGVKTTDGYVHQHNHWDTKNRKDCPHNIRKGVPYIWTVFVAKVAFNLAAMQGKSPTETVPAGTPPIPSGDNTGLLHVQVGAFASQANANAFMLRVKRAGFAAFVKPDGKLYHVQVGAFSDKKNAEAYMQEVKAAGFDAFIK